MPPITIDSGLSKINKTEAKIPLDTEAQVKNIFKDITDAETANILSYVAETNPDALKLAYQKRFPKGESISVKNEAELQKELRENNLISYASDTAKDEYNKASEKDKEYLRKITKYESGSMILMTPEGKELCRSHGILNPTTLIGQNSFKNKDYNNGVGIQKNVEAKWIDWFGDEKGDKPGTYDIKASVLATTGIKGNITAGSIGEWENIYKLFSPVNNNYGSEDVSGMQVARAMMGITGWIWTNEKVFDNARYYKLQLGNCDWYLDHSNKVYISIVGLENLKHGE